MLETCCHPYSSFLTLTYDDDNLPNDGSLSPTHLKNFLKLLRSKLPNQIRFYAVGEYGPKNLRPHYHLALFGVMPCQFPQPSNLKGALTRNKTSKQITCSCKNCQFLYDLWNKGIIYNGRLEKDSAQYVAGYIMDKVNKDSTDLLNLEPEFTRMSLQNGIGLGFNGEGLHFLKNFMETELGKKYYSEFGDVPHNINIGGKPWPLGRYLRRKLREMLGKELRTPAHILYRCDEERLAELKEWRDENIDRTKITPLLYNDKLAYQEMKKQKRKNKESKYQLFQKRAKKL